MATTLLMAVSTYTQQINNTNPWSPAMAYNHHKFTLSFLRLAGVINEVMADYVESTPDGERCPPGGTIEVEWDQGTNTITITSQHNGVESIGQMLEMLASKHPGAYLKETTEVEE